MTTLGIFENFLDDPVMESELKSDKMDLLSTSIQESGLFNEANEVSCKRHMVAACELPYVDADKAEHCDFRTGDVSVGWKQMRCSIPSSPAPMRRFKVEALTGLCLTPVLTAVAISNNVCCHRSQPTSWT